MTLQLKNVSKVTLAVILCGTLSCFGVTTNAYAADKTTKSVYNSAQSVALQTQIANKFVAGGVLDDIDSSSYEAALGLNALGMADKIDTIKIIANLKNEEETNAYYSAGTKAKYVLALTAAGVDCTKVSVGGTERNLVQEILDNVNSFKSIYSCGTFLAIFEYGSYNLNGQDTAINTIINWIINENTDISGGIFSAWGYDDESATAEAVAALVPYKDRAGVQAWLDSAKAALIARITVTHTDGSVDGGGSWSDTLDGTAKVVVALSALDVDPATIVSTTGAAAGSSAAGYVLARATAELTDDNPNSLGKALQALYASENIGSNPYKFKSTEPEPEPTPTPQEEATEAEPTISATGDVTPVALSALGALCGACGLVIACRKLNARK